MFIVYIFLATILCFALFKFRTQLWLLLMKTFTVDICQVAILYLVSLWLLSYQPLIHGLLWLYSMLCIVRIN